MDAESRTGDSVPVVDVDWRIESVNPLESDAGNESDGGGDPECDRITLVRVVLQNTATVSQTVRVRNELAGPVLPPRQRGVPEAGWSRDGFEGTVPADGRLSLGYASPAPAVEPPVTVDRLGRCSVDEEPPQPAAVVRDQGRYRPPTDAVPATEPTVSESSADGDEMADTEATTRTAGERSAPGVEADGGDGATPPPAAAKWLRTVERRVERAERLDGASVSEATDVLSATGGIEGVVGLDERLDRDAAALEATAERAAELADRAEQASIPTSALRRLA